MTFLAWLAFVCSLFPKNLAGLLINCNQLPLMRGPIIRCISISIESSLECRIAAAAYCGRYKDPIAPDDRTRMGKSRQASFPLYAGPSFAIPSFGKILAVGYSRGVIATK